MKFPPKSIVRLTLSKEAFQLAIARATPIIGYVRRKDEKVDVAVRAAVMNLLQQLARHNENLSDTFVRVVSKKESA